MQIYFGPIKRKNTILGMAMDGKVEEERQETPVSKTSRCGPTDGISSFFQKWSA